MPAPLVTPLCVHHKLFSVLTLISTGPLEATTSLLPSLHLYITTRSNDTQQRQTTATQILMYQTQLANKVYRNPTSHKADIIQQSNRLEGKLGGF